MKQRGNVWVVILAIIATLGIAAAAYFYGQAQGLKGKPGAAVTVASPVATEVSASLPTPTPASKVTVVFEAEGSFTAAEKAEIQKKVIDPFLDYYKEPGASAQNLLTLTISKNTQASKDQYPYMGNAIFDGGGNIGFLIMKVG